MIQTNDPHASDITLRPAAIVLVLIAALLHGCADGGTGGTPGDGVGPSVPDATAPTVSLTAPGDGSTMNGWRAIRATANDNVGVAGVQFRLNGVNLSAEDVSLPYELQWNTALVSNGSYTLTAVARDAAGNTTVSAGVTVTIANVAGLADYARGVPHPAAQFGWDPLTYDTSSVTPVTACPTSVVFNGTAAAPHVVRGGGLTCPATIQVSGQHGILEDFLFGNIESSVRVTNASFVVIRHITHVGNNTGTSNGSSMAVTFSHDIVYFQNTIRNLRDNSGTTEVDYMGFMTRNDDFRIWYLDNDVYQLGGDSLRTGTNFVSLNPGESETTDVYVARNRFGGNGENPIDLKRSNRIVISGNDLYDARLSGSSAGEIIVAHEDAQDVYVYDNIIRNAQLGVVTATSGGGARQITVDGNTFTDIGRFGVYNRGGGHATVTNNTFTRVATPIETNPNNGSTTTESGNVIVP
jgi:Bacterial Ig domain